MKIGILTLPLHTNYGGLLQAYALQTVLQRMEHEVTVISQDRDIHRNAFRQVVSFGLFLVRKYLLGRKTIKYNSPGKINRERQEREQYTQAFTDKYINTYLVRNLATDVPKGFDAFIVGSDQIWRKRYVEELYFVGVENAFLKFAEAESVKRIAYAPSFGTDDWEYNEEETKECARLLGLFDAVSVREQSAIALCEKYLGRKDVQHVFDPTLLLSKEDYISLIENAKTPKSEGNLMCYVLDNVEEKKDFIKKIAEDRGLQPFYTNSKIYDGKAAQKDRIQPPLEKWLRGFMDAEFIITDSFHACVFSIIFGKPFVVIGNKERGMARFKSLLSMFALEKNLICDPEEYNASYSYEVNEKAYTLLEEKKKQSISFIMKSLS